MSKPIHARPRTKKPRAASLDAVVRRRTPSQDIWDMVQTCDLTPGEDTTRRLLDICMMLEERIAAIERDRAGAAVVTTAVKPPNDDKSTGANTKAERKTR